MAGATCTAADGLVGQFAGAEQSFPEWSSPLLAIAPGPAKVLKSSSSLSWRGILMEKHLNPPGGRTSARINSHVLSTTTDSFRFEYRKPSGEFVACLNRPGSIMVTPIGVVPDMQLHDASEFLHCALEESLVGEVIQDLHRAISSPIFRSGIQDRSIQRILGLLVEELESPMRLGGLYVDSLAQALATRYVLLEPAQIRRKPAKPVGLTPRVLRRVREKIEANLDTDLSLQTLAQESGYSRAHFLRLFRLATGQTPHQFVLSLRLKRAQSQLKQGGAGIIDIALSCGFSSQSHMTSLFRQKLGTTPSEFRRNS